MGLIPQCPGIPQFQNFNQNLGGVPSTSAPQQSLQISQQPQLLGNPNFMDGYPRKDVQQPPLSYAQHLPQLPFGQQSHNEMTHKQG